MSIRHQLHLALIENLTALENKLTTKKIRYEYRLVIT